MWYEWNSKEEFDLWHNNLCANLGYPLTPVNQLTELPDEDAQKVTAYTQAYKVDNKWIAVVDEEYAQDLQSTNKTLQQPTF
jgi:hypothetical protein